MGSLFTREPGPYSREHAVILRTVRCSTPDTGTNSLVGRVLSPNNDEDTRGAAGEIAVRWKVISKALEAFSNPLRIRSSSPVFISSKAHHYKIHTWDQTQNFHASAVIPLEPPSTSIC